MSPRILHLVGDSSFGGGAHVILRLAQLWHSFGWTVDLLATDPVFLTAAAEAGVPTVPLDAIRREIRPLRDLVGLYHLYRFLRAHPYTIVHTHTTKAGFVGPWAARLAGVPIVVHTVHGFAFHEASSKAKIAFYTALERLASYCRDRVVAVSQFHCAWGARLRMCPSKKWIAIPNGIPAMETVPPERIALLRQSWGVTPETLVVLAHGRLAPEKGLEHLIHTAGRLKAQWKRPFLFLLAGEGPLRGELERMAKHSQVEHHVRFLGFRRDMNDLLAAADIVALPSLREGLSIALLEAMAMARPIIATTIGSNREVTREGQGALLIQPDSLEQLEHAIRRLGDDPEEARRLARRAGEIYREQYTIDRMLAGYRQLYLDLLTSRKLGAGLAPNSKEIHTEINREEHDHAERIPALLPSLDR